MSKSSGNYVGIAEPATEQFGKVMSIADPTMFEWIKYETRWDPDRIARLVSDAEQGRLHPMELKKMLAWEIVSTFHGDDEANQAREHFESVHQRGQTPDDLPVAHLSGPTRLIDLMVDNRVAGSRNQARRLIDGSGVRVDGTVVTSYDEVLNQTCTVQVGKRRFLKVLKVNP